AEVYELTGDNSKADEIYKESIKEVNPDKTSLLQLGNALLAKGKMEMALQVFEIGKKQVKDFPFGLFTGEIYGKIGKNDKMINDYIDVFDDFPIHSVQVQAKLSSAIDFEDSNSPTREVLRTTLLKNVQRHPDKESYIQLLIWYYLESKDYSSAMIQTKALDKRTKSEGEHVIYLCRTAFVPKKAYDIAIDGYNYVIDTYPNGRNLQTAHRELMEALYIKVTSSAYTQQD